MDAIFIKLISQFDFAYMLVINILTYFLIKLADEANGDKAVTVWQKRLLFIGVSIFVTIVYIIIGYDNKLILVNSFILAPVAWSWIIRPVAEKMGLGYKKIN